MGAPILSLFPPGDFSLIALILALPLVGAFVNGIWGRRPGKAAVRLMALTAIGASFVAATFAFAALHTYVDAEHHEHVKLAWTAWSWMHTNGGHDAATIPIDLRFSLDALSGVPARDQPLPRRLDPASERRNESQTCDDDASHLALRVTSKKACDQAVWEGVYHDARGRGRRKTEVKPPCSFPGI